jgi:cellulose biosynthesis protein BcsQ
MVVDQGMVNLASEIFVRKFITFMMALRKGGVGKTTIGVNVAVFLAALGFHVVIIDGDSQRNASELSIIRDLQGGKVRTRPYSNGTFRHAVLGEKSLKEVMYQVRKNLWVVPSDERLNMGRYYIQDTKDYNIVQRILDEFSNALEPAPPIEERFPGWSNKGKVIDMSAFRLEHTSDEDFVSPPIFVDFVVMDTPPKEDDELVIAMTYGAEKILVPSQMAEFSIQGMRQLVTSLQTRFADRARKAEIVGIIPNMVMHFPRSAHYELDYIRSLWQYFPQFTLRPVHFDVALSDAQTLHTTTLEYVKEKGLNSRATRELADIALRISGFKGRLAGLQSCQYCTQATKEGIELYKAAQAQKSERRA